MNKYITMFFASTTMFLWIYANVLIEEIELLEIETKKQEDNHKKVYTECAHLYIEFLEYQHKCINEHY